jgi:hypothetical protein
MRPCRVLWLGVLAIVLHGACVWAQTPLSAHPDACTAEAMMARKSLIWHGDMIDGIVERRRMQIDADTLFQAAAYLRPYRRWYPNEHKKFAHDFLAHFPPSAVPGHLGPAEIAALLRDKYGSNPRAWPRLERLTLSLDGGRTETKVLNIVAAVQRFWPFTFADDGGDFANKVVCTRGLAISYELLAGEPTAPGAPSGGDRILFLLSRPLEDGVRGTPVCGDFARQLLALDGLRGVRLQNAARRITTESLDYAGAILESAVTEVSPTAGFDPGVVFRVHEPGYDGPTDTYTFANAPLDFTPRLDMTPTELEKYATTHYLTVVPSMEERESNVCGGTLREIAQNCAREQRLRLLDLSTEHIADQIGLDRIAPLSHAPEYHRDAMLVQSCAGCHGRIETEEYGPLATERGYHLEVAHEGGHRVVRPSPLTLLELCYRADGLEEATTTGSGTEFGRLYYKAVYRPDMVLWSFDRNGRPE